MKNESSDLLAAGKTEKAKKMKRKENNFVEVSVATKKFKASAVAVATECDADYSAQSQLVFEIISEDGLRVISYDINREIFYFINHCYQDLFKFMLYFYRGVESHYG